MAGHKEGGIKARDTNLKLYGQDWYKKIGSMGGKAGTGGGFGAGELGRERARIYGKLGGSKSRRTDQTAPHHKPQPKEQDLFCKYCGGFGHIQGECKQLIEDTQRKARLLEKYGVKRDW